jgi:hypothetical protein
MKPHATAINQRLLRGQTPSYERLQARLAEDGSELAPPHRRALRLGPAADRPHLSRPGQPGQELLNEQPGERDIALYVAAPQQMLGWNRRSCFSIRPTPCACGSAITARPPGYFAAFASAVPKAKRTGRRSISCTRRAACCRSMPRC